MDMVRNNELLRQSIISTLQYNWEELKKVEKKIIDSYSINNAGTITRLYGVKDLNEKKAEIQKELNRLFEELDEVEKEIEEE